MLYFKVIKLQVNYESHHLKSDSFFVTSVTKSRVVNTTYYSEAWSADVLTAQQATYLSRQATVTSASTGGWLIPLVSFIEL